jgi:flagellar hook-associated protein 2
MAIASSGIISGLDVSSLIKASMVYERLPLERLQKQLSTTESKISALGQIKSAIGSLQEAAKALSNSDDLYSYKASLSNPDVATVTASGKAAAGSYSVEVTQLATSHKLTSAVGIDTSQGGELKIQVGSGVEKSVNVKANASLSDVAKAINDANAGVSATVVNGTAGAQLVLTGNETGAANQIKITSSTISDLNFDPADSTANSKMTQVAAVDAELRIDTIDIKSASNTITDAVTGVNLTLKATTAANNPAQLTISNDSADFETKLKTFVDAYNKARSTMKDLSSYDAADKSAAVLNGDSTVSGALNQLRGLLSATPAGISDLDVYKSLVSLGVETSATGVLSINSSKLTSAMEADFTAVAKTISAYGSAFDKLTTQMNGSDGLIASRLDGLNSTTSRLKDGISAQERRMVLVQARYEKQFANLETLLSSLTTTSNYLGQQLASLNSLSGG